MANFWDEIIIKHPYGIILDEVAYDFYGEFPNYSGTSMMLLSQDYDNNQGDNWVLSTQLMSNGDYGTPGQSNILECEANLDLNQDGNINIIDVISLVNHITGLLLLDDLCIADFDSDGNINVVDIVYIVSYILN